MDLFRLRSKQQTAEGNERRKTSRSKSKDHESRKSKSKKESRRLSKEASRYARGDSRENTKSRRTESRKAPHGTSLETGLSKSKLLQASSSLRSIPEARCDAIESSPTTTGSPDTTRHHDNSLSTVPNHRTDQNVQSDVLKDPSSNTQENAEFNPLRVQIPKNSNLIAARNHFRKSGMSPSDFEWYETVGKGTFGNVKMVKLNHRATERIYAQGCPKLPKLAIKTMKKSNILHMDQVEHIRAEVTTLASVDHPFIIGLYGVMQDARCLYLLMEYIKGGELFNLLATFNMFNFDQTQFYAAQVTLAFEYLHARKIAYRDLKPENILLDSQGHIKIADFGFAKVIDQRSWTICGTPEYIAPEIIMSRGHSTGVDWWGLGILIYEMITGQPPFVHENTMVLYRMIQDVQYTFPRSIDVRTKDLVRRLLVKDLTRRYGCLKGGADDVKRHKFFKGIKWQGLINRTVSAPWKPEINDSEPANKYFDHYPESIEEPERISQSDDQRFFSWFDKW